MSKYNLKKSQFGDKWPFIPEKIKVKVKNKAATVEADGVTYNLNGIASTLNIGLDINPIWLDNKEIPGTKKSLNCIFLFLMDKGEL